MTLMDNIYVMKNYVIIFLVVLLLTAVFVPIYTSLRDTSSGESREVAENSLRFPGMMDKFFFFLWLGLILGAGILALFVEYSPIMLPFTIIVYIIGALYSWITGKIIDNFFASMTTQAAYLPLLSFLAEHWIWLNVAGLGYVILMMYIRPFKRGGYI